MQPRMDNPETWATLGAQDTVLRETKQKTQYIKHKKQKRWATRPKTGG